MSNGFVNLPLPVANGPGAAVSTAALGGPKTFLCYGSFPGATITIEVSCDGGTTFAPLIAFQTSGDRKNVQVAADFMRVNVSGRSAAVPFSAQIDVGAPAAATNFAEIDIPVGPGPGAALDISDYGPFVTLVCSGSFPGSAIEIQVSDDGGTTWTTVAQFSGRGDAIMTVFTAQQVRANVKNRNVNGLATLAIGAYDAASSPAPASDGAEYFDDFISVANVANSVAGGATVLNNDTVRPTFVGLVRVTGNGEGDAACLFPNSDPLNVGFAMPIFNFSEGRFTCEWRLEWLGPIPGGEVDAQAFIGVHDLPIAGGADGVPSDGAFFQCGAALTGGSTWFARVMGNGDFAVDTGVPVTADPVRLRVDVTFGGDALFYIDDVLVATIAHDDADTDGFDLTAAADVQFVTGLFNVAFDYYDLNVFFDRS